MAKGRTEQIAGIDLLRFGAAFMVMASHIAYLSFTSQETYLGSSHGAAGSSLNSGPLFPMAQFGWIGVPVFFVISGFVIAYTANGASVFSYVKSRLVRLLPAAWICATITATLLWVTHLYWRQEIAEHYLRSITLFPIGPWISDVYWTLPIEIAFYVVILMLLVSDRMKRAEHTFTAIGLISSFSWLSLLALDKLRFFSHPAAVEAFRRPLYQITSDILFSRPAQLGLLSFGCYFATGLIIYVATRYGYTAKRIAMLVLISAGGLAYITENNQFSIHRNYASWPAMLIYLGSLAFIVLSVRFNSIFPKRFTREIGLGTYPLYLLHNVVGSFVFGRLFIRIMPAPEAAAMAMALCLVIVFVVVRPLERRVQNGLRRMIDMAFERICDSNLLRRFSTKPTCAP